MTQTKAELLQTRHQGDLKLGDADSSHYVGFKAPATVSSSLVWTLPAADGSANQFLQTNASGVLGWGTADVSSAIPLTGGTFTGDVTFDGATAGRDIVFDRSDNALEFADNATLKFGDGGDLTINHDGSNSYIDVYTNNLLIRDTNGNMATFVQDGAVNLYFDNSLKFATNNTGVAITGALTVSTDATITGNLTVSGTTTTINTQTLDVEDKNIVVGKVSTPSDTTADGGGWTLKGATDKTWNWINATDAWTSSEHIHLLDNKKLFVGGASGTTDGLELSHNGTNSFIADTGTGYLVVKANRTEFINAAGNEVLINAVENGAVTLYHNNSAKIATTATGIDVTGAITVGGAALASGNTVDLVADGAIAAGKPVIIKSNGKAEQVKVVNTARTSGYNGTTVSQQNDGSANGYQTRHHSSVWDDTNDRFYTLQGHASGGFAWLHTWTVNSSNGVVTYGGNTSSSNHATGNNDSQRMDIAWSTTDEMLLEVYKTNSGNYINYRVYDPGSYSGSTLQWSSGSELEVHSGDADSVRLAYDSTRNKFVCSFRDKVDSNKMAIYVGTLNTSAKTVTWGSKQTVDSRTQCGFRHGICSMGSGNFCVAYSSSNEVYAKIGAISSSANSATFGSEGEITNTSLQGEYPEVEYEFAQSKLVFVYRDPNNGYIKAQSATHSGTSFSYISLSPAAIYSANVHHLYRPVYNSLSGLIYVLIVVEENGGTPRLNYVDVSSTHPSVGNNVDFNGNDVEAIHDIAFNNNQGEVFYVGCNSTTNDMNAVRIPAIVQSTNVNDDNPIGFAPAAISDTATGTINLDGNTVDNQSGLTAGSRYYIQSDGSLSTSRYSPYSGGLALSSSKLLIKMSQG